MPRINLQLTRLRAAEIPDLGGQPLVPRQSWSAVGGGFSFDQPRRITFAAEPTESRSTRNAAPANIDATGITWRLMLLIRESRGSGRAMIFIPFKERDNRLSPSLHWGFTVVLAGGQMLTYQRVVFPREFAHRLAAFNDGIFVMLAISDVSAWNGSRQYCDRSRLVSSRN